MLALRETFRGSVHKKGGLAAEHNQLKCLEGSRMVVTNQKVMDTHTHTHTHVHAHTHTHTHNDNMYE